MLYFQTLDSNGNWVIRDEKGRMRSPQFATYAELLAYYVSKMSNDSDDSDGAEPQETFDSDEAVAA